jgi:hypothetical protein
MAGWACRGGRIAQVSRDSFAGAAYARLEVASGENVLRR